MKIRVMETEWYPFYEEEELTSKYGLVIELSDKEYKEYKKAVETFNKYQDMFKNLWDASDD
jgi:hypothetical protein